ncbi:hypothetical protein MEME101129_22565 [Methylobacterium mesophilicum]
MPPDPPSFFWRRLHAGAPARWWRRSSADRPRKPSTLQPEVGPRCRACASAGSGCRRSCRARNAPGCRPTAHSCAAARRSRSAPVGRPPDPCRVRLSEAAARSPPTLHPSGQTAPSSVFHSENQRRPDQTVPPVMGSRPKATPTWRSCCAASTRPTTAAGSACSRGSRPRWCCVSVSKPIPHWPTQPTDRPVLLSSNAPSASLQMPRRSRIQTLDLDPDTLGFLDETATNTKMVHRYRRLSFGEHRRVAVPFGHWTAIAITASLIHVSFKIFNTTCWSAII